MLTILKVLFFGALAILILTDILAAMTGFVFFIATLMPPAMWGGTVFFGILLACDLLKDYAFVKDWVLTRRWPNILGALVHLTWFALFAGLLVMPQPPHIALPAYATVYSILFFIFWWLLAFNGLFFCFHIALISKRVRDRIQQENEESQPKEAYN